MRKVFSFKGLGQEGSKKIAAAKHLRIRRQNVKAVAKDAVDAWWWLP